MPMLFTSESPKLAEESRGVQMRTSVLRSFVRETCSTSQTFKTPLHSTTLSPLPSPTLFFILQDVPEVCINPLISSLSFHRFQCVNWGEALTRHSALTKTAVRASRTAFRPAVSTSLRAGSARFASDSVLHGKIHQVIGKSLSPEKIVQQANSIFRCCCGCPSPPIYRSRTDINTLYRSNLIPTSSLPF